MSQYIYGQIVTLVKAMMDRVQIGQRNPTVYQALLVHLQTPNSPIYMAFMQYINQQTNGSWVNGIHQDQMVGILKPWVNDALARIEQQLNQQAQPMGNFPQQQGYMPQAGFMQPIGMSSTGSIYDANPAPAQQQPAPQMPQIQTWAPMVDSVATLPEREFSMENLDLGRPISFNLIPTDTLQHHPKPGNVVDVKNYREGVFEDTRLSTIDIELNTAENNAADAARKAVAYSPNEVLRGLYANIVYYKEIFHIPMKHVEFKKIAERIGTAFYATKGQRDWRDAVKIMGELTRAEHKIIETALLKLLNPSIAKYLRTSDGYSIVNIGEIDDLRELDDPRSTLKVTHHAQYLNRLNEIVGRAFENLIKPSNLIEADDINFGDFVHCNQIEFWHDNRSKYDYGTYPEKVDRLKFIESMTDSHTVLRINKCLVVTNALDSRLVSNITYSRPRDQIKLNDTQNLGFKLMLDLGAPKRGEIESVVCIGESQTQAPQCINMGTTLDGTMVLVK